MVFSEKLNTMLDDWTQDSAFENPIMRQKASKIWAEVMHNFARVLMIDLYSLPEKLINQWTKITTLYQTNRSLINMGQWALTYRLQKQNVEPQGAAAASEPPPATSTFSAKAPAQADWDELPGLFSARLEQAEAPMRTMDAMELAIDKSRWVPSEALHDTTCQPKSEGL